MAPLLILTPLAVEHAALRAALFAGNSPNPDVNLAVGGHGKVQFALTTQLLLQSIRPRLVICAGAAGALDPMVKPLDVVAGEFTLEHDYRLRFVTRPLPRFPGAQTALEVLKGWHKEAAGFTLHFGALASGDEDVIDVARAAEIRSMTGALAVAWEGAGGARACRQHDVPFIEIRAVTDAADGLAPQAFTENVARAMRNVAAVIQTLI